MVSKTWSIHDDDDELQGYGESLPLNFKKK